MLCSWLLCLIAAGLDPRFDIFVKRSMVGLQATEVQARVFAHYTSLQSHELFALPPAQGFVHSQLRQRIGAMLEVLERASFAAQEQKTRKTSSGCTFVEQAAASTA